MSWIVDVENILAGWFKLVMNTPTPVNRIILVWSGEKGVRPSTDYVMFKCDDIKNIGMPYKSQVDISVDLDGIQEIVRTKQFTLNIDAFGRSAVDYCQALKDSLDDLEVNDFLTANKIAALDSTEINDLSFAEDDGTEIRYHFEIVFGVAFAEEVERTYIENISGIGTVTGFEGNEKELTIEEED